MEVAYGLAILGALAFTVGLFTEPIRRFGGGELLLATALGVAVGPVGLGLIDPFAWPHEEVLSHLAELTMAVVLIGLPIRLPHQWTRENLGPIARLVVGGTLGMWLASSLLAHLVLGASWPLAFLLGAVAAPTDPILAGSVVEGLTARGLIPARLRDLALAEAGANDGLARVVVLAPLTLLVFGSDWPLRFLDEGLLRGLVVATASGALVGVGLAKIERTSAQRGWADRTTLLSLMMASAILLVGVSSMLEANGVWAAFVAGIALDHSRDEISEQEEKVQQSVKNFFQLPVFLLFGMLIPWRAWAGIGLGALAFVLLLLVLRRIPVLLAMKPVLGPLQTWRDAAFLGWFGPIGVAAIYYALYAKERTGEEIVWTVASLVVATSVVVHGLTAYPLSRWLARREPASSGEDAEEPGEDERAQQGLA